MIPEEVLAPLRALHQLGALQGRGELLHVEASFFGPARVLLARRRLLAALVAWQAPLRLQVIDPEGDAADLDRLGLARDGASRLVPADADLGELDRVSLHAGGWFLHASTHADLYPLCGDEDPFRSMVLAEIVTRGDASLIVASFYDDREWLLAGLV